MSCITIYSYCSTYTNHQTKYLHYIWIRMCIFLGEGIYLALRFSGYFSTYLDWRKSVLQAKRADAKVCNTVIQSIQFCRCWKDGVFGSGGEISLTVQFIPGQRFNCLVISKVRHTQNIPPKSCFIFHTLGFYYFFWVGSQIRKLELFLPAYQKQQSREEKTFNPLDTVSYIFIWKEPPLILKYLAPAHKVIWNSCRVVSPTQ